MKKRSALQMGLNQIEVEKMATVLTQGTRITAKNLYGESYTGEVEIFGEHTVILSKGVERVVIKKDELATQGYEFPPYTRQKKFQIAY